MKNIKTLYVWGIDGGILFILTIYYQCFDHHIKLLYYFSLKTLNICQIHNFDTMSTEMTATSVIHKALLLNQFCHDLRILA